MKRTVPIPIVLMGFLAALFGCGQQPAPPAETSETAPIEGVFMIDYAHEASGVFHHGTLSLIDGKVGVTWTLDEGGKKTSHDLVMTEETFRSVWDAFNDVPDFSASAVKDPNQQLDTSTHHIVGIVFNLDGQQGTRTHMIPVTTASPAFKQWLTSIGYAGK